MKRWVRDEIKKTAILSIQSRILPLIRQFGWVFPGLIVTLASDLLLIR